MALAVVISPNGIPVSQAPSPYGFPVILATNGFGVPVTPVASGGRAVFDVGGNLFDSGSSVGPNYRVRAQAGSFVFTGEAMTIIAGYTMAAQAGAFALAGQSATLTPPVVVSATTWDPAVIPASITLDGTKLIATSGFSVAGMVRSTTSAASGKKYFKCTPTFATGINTFGFCNASASNTSIIGVDGNSLGIVQEGTIQVGGSGFTTGGSYASGDTPEMAVDFTANLIWFRNNGGNWNGSSSNDPATGVGGISMAGHGLGSGPWFAAMFIVGSGGTQATATANFLGTPPAGFTNW